MKDRQKILVVSFFIMVFTFLPVLYAAKESHTPLFDLETAINSHFGFFNSWAGAVPNPELEALDIAPFKELGLKWARPLLGPFRWEFIEPIQGGGYNFFYTDSVVMSYEAENIQILAIIWPYVQWDQEFYQKGNWFFNQFPRMPKSRYTPHDTVAYSAWIQAMVERYDGDGIDDMPGLRYPIKSWELLNEPFNFGNFHGSAEVYAELMKLTYQAVKAADTSASVLHGGIWSLEPDPYTWFNDFLNQDGSDYFDVSSFQFARRTLEDFGSGVWTKLLSQYGKKRWWMTSIRFTCDFEETDQLCQGKYLIIGVVQSFANGAERVFFCHYTPPPFIPGWNDGFDQNDGLNPHGMHLVNRDGTRRPAFNTVKTLVEKLEGFTGIETIKKGQYKFIVKDRPVYVMWADENQSKQKPIWNLQGMIRVTDQLGNVSELNASKFVLTEYPVFVEPLSL